MDASTLTAPRGPFGPRFCAGATRRLPRSPLKVSARWRGDCHEQTALPHQIDDRHQTLRPTKAVQKAAEDTSIAPAPVAQTVEVIFIASITRGTRHSHDSVKKRSPILDATCHRAALREGHGLHRADRRSDGRPGWVARGRSTTGGLYQLVSRAKSIHRVGAVQVC